MSTRPLPVSLLLAEEPPDCPLGLTHYAPKTPGAACPSCASRCQTVQLPGEGSGQPFFEEPHHRGHRLLRLLWRDPHLLGNELYEFIHHDHLSLEESCRL
jgi:hypothetical protein